MTRRLQLRAQLLKIVDLTVAYAYDGAVLIVDRLMAAADIDDGKAPHTEQQFAIDKCAFVVRSAMKRDRTHARQQRTIDRCRVLERNDSVNAAHARFNP